jgi:tetratricopeptide (TPR) repeat protein
MKKGLIGLLICFFAINLAAQTLTVKQLQENAQVFMQQGEYDNAVASLLKARQQSPLNMDLLTNLSFAYFLQRDFSKAIETGKIAIELNDADQKAFQVLGLSYKAIALYKEANKMYKLALKKFPNGGVIYNEYGESLALDKNLKEAIIQWEKGIQLDPNYSGNYFNAVKYYVDQQNWWRIILYGETYINLDSYSAKTTEVKNQLLIAYKNLLQTSIVEQLQKGPSFSGFEKTALLVWQSVLQKNSNGFVIDSLSSIKKAFLQQWESNKLQYPFRLFDHWQQLNNDGILTAYHQWIFGDAVDANDYLKWQVAHAKEFVLYQQFQQSRVFKIPAGQYYF